MAIPTDASLRVRLPTDTPVSPLAATKELPGDLPEFSPGQSFTARIQQPLPENSYRALVGGKEITLSLPDKVQSGDVLELVVVERNSRMVLAQLANTPAARAASGEEGVEARNTQLSPAAQLIGRLLPPPGQAPQPVALNAGQPLLGLPLPTGGDLAAQLAPRLQQAAEQSGLFYEAHQAQWISGRKGIEALREEPQGRLPLQPAPARAGGDNPAAEAKLAATAAAPGGEADSTAGAGRDLLQSIPAELRPLVQQQLDAAATQRLVWQGEVWPGQTMQWQVSRDGSPRPGGEETAPWNTALALTTPRLGRVEATLGIAGDTVSIALSVDAAPSGATLRAALPILQSALEAAGLKPLSLRVRDGGG